MTRDIVPDPPKRVGYLKQMLIGMALMEPPDDFDDLPPDAPRPPQDLDWIVTAPNLEPPVGHAEDIPQAALATDLAPLAPEEPATEPVEAIPPFPPPGMVLEDAPPTRQTPGVVHLEEAEVMLLMQARSTVRDRKRLAVDDAVDALRQAESELQAAQNLLALVRGGHSIVVGVPST